MEDENKNSFTVVMRNYFGYQPGKGLKEFAQGFRSMGIDCKDPV